MKRLVLFISAFLLTIAGQNCSEVAFLGAAKDDIVKSGDPTDQDPTDPTCENGLPGADCDEDGEEDEEFLARECIPGAEGPVVVTGGATDIVRSDVRGGLLIDEARILEVSDVRGGLRVGRALEATISNIRGKVQVSTNLLHDFSNTRGPLRALAVVANTISDHRGPICLTTNEVDSISNTRGPIRIYGGSGAEIGSISNARGPIYLENVHVGSIDNHRGPIYLKNSTVDSITNKRGPIREL